MIELEDRKTYRLPGGATLFVNTFQGEDTVILFNKTRQHSVQAYTGNTPTGADIGVYFDDNIKLEKFGFKKQNPRFRLTEQEWKCTLEIEHAEGGTMRVQKLNRKEET